MSKFLKFGIFILVLIILSLVLVIVLDIPLNPDVIGSPADPAETPDPEDSFPDLALTVKDSLATATGHWGENQYDIDHIQVQDDGQMAIVWLAPVDPETGDWLGREPELALAELDSKGKWQVLLEGDDKFAEVFQTFQYRSNNIQGDLLPAGEAQQKTDRVFGGYYLPWAASLEKRLTWSVGHTSCYPIYYCTHAFDFADGTMFPLVAAKGGTVFHWRDTCANGDTYCTNSITIQDRSTTPWTYQIYLHIAQDSVPDQLREVGTPVLQGQYIANVDDTGYSSGHHVHFMVVAEETRYMSSSMQSVWGVAEDITFRDVDINWDPVTQGGRPRLEYEAETYGGEGRTYYISGNLPANPPTGGLTAPARKALVTTPLMTVSGWGQDDISVTKMEIMAKIGTNWVQIGDAQTTNPFTTDVDLCDTEIPDGPFLLGLRVWDYEGNPSPILAVRPLIKDVECFAGVDPKVSLTLKDGVLALPQSGLVNATVTKGSTGSAIESVEFYMHDQDWSHNNWIYLGKDVNGINGWQAAINTVGLDEGSNYTIVAVAKDLAGNMDADVKFNAIVDATQPWLTVDPITSPVRDSAVTITWEGGDDLTGLDHYSLECSVNNGAFSSLEASLPASTTSYQMAASEAQLIVFKLTAYDKSGNKTEQLAPVYTDGYEFENSYIYPLYIFDD